MPDTTLDQDPQNKIHRAFWTMCLAWPFFQVWITSPLPFWFNIEVFDKTQTHAIQLSLAILLTWLSFGQNYPSSSVRAWDITLAYLAIWGCSELFVFYDALAHHAGSPLLIDLIAAATGLLLLLKGTRHVLGLPLVIVASIFLLYSVAGPLVPDMIAHQSASLNKLLSHPWLTTVGVFGIALGLSADLGLQILALEQPNPLALWYLSALALLAWVGWNQTCRRLAAG